MNAQKLPSAAAMAIVVTATGTTLESLIATAFGSAYTFPNNVSLNALDIVPEGADIRIGLDGNIPTTTLGLRLISNKLYTLRGPALRNVRLCRVAGVDVTCSIQIGQSDQGETSSSGG